MDILDNLEQAIEKAKKLTTKDRKKLKDSDFCGPNRSFPVVDCQHVGTARAFLSRSKLSDSTKKKITTCINAKAKSLKCGDKDKASQGTSFSYKDLSSAEKDLYTSEIFASTEKLVADSIVLPGSI